MRVRLGKALALGIAILVVAAPAANALNVATRSIKARPSSTYSPDTAWEENHYGCNVTVAVFDEGVDDGHPYFEGKVAGGKDTTATGPAWEAAGEEPDPILGQHGTPVAGIAVSNAGQAFTDRDDKPDYAEDALVGVAPCAHLVDVQFNDVASTESLEQDVVQAYEWAIEHRDHDWGDDDPTNDGIDVITMSWSPNDQTDGSDPICEAATDAVEAGIVVLGSAGNSGNREEPDLGCPTGADGAISVANLYNQRTVNRSDDELRDSSTWGPRTDDEDSNPYEELKPTIAAPGHNVISAGWSAADGTEYTLACFGARDMPEDVRLASYLLPTCEAEFGGTSAATPMTAGVVALMLDANPDLQPAGVTAILHQTAEPHEEMERDAKNLSAQWDQRYGYGMIDAHAAVEMAEQWPGLEKGRDLDADGIRDPIDVAPMDPSIRNVTVPENLTAVGGDVDTDGDGVVDAVDRAPLDPRASDESLTPANASQADDDTLGVPGPGAVLASLAVLAGARVAAPRRRG